MTTHEATSTPRRRPGNSAGITRDRIVDAARHLDPDTLTLQAVANRLGVDRKAVVYHVTDRDGLMELLAADAFSETFASTVIPPDADWKESIVVYARAMKSSLLASGPLVPYFRFSNPAGASSLVAAELLMEKMIEAGLDAQTTGRVMTLLANNVMGYARDVAMSEASGEHPQQAEVHRIVNSPSGATLNAMRTLDEMQFSSHDEAQFEFAIAVLVAGIEDRLLHQLSGAAAPSHED